MVLKTVLIIGFVWPEPQSSAAGSRMMQLINFFLTSKYRVVFCSASSKNKQSTDLEILGVETTSIELNSSSFDTFVSELQPDIVMFDRFMIEEQYGWRVAENCPKAIRLLDSEDLHFLRKARERAVKNNAPFDHEYFDDPVTKREIASIYRCDLTLTISEFEMEVLEETFNIDGALLLYVPFLLNHLMEESISKFPTFKERRHFISIGNFLHPPNFDAVSYLKKEIWPLIQSRLPETEMHLYGAYPSQKAFQLTDAKQRFFVKGFVEDADLVMQNARVCLAPLRFGAGLKGKLISSMTNGTPSVMTSIAAEGLFGSLAPSGFIEDSPSDFVGRAVQLYSEETLWREKQLNGYHVINTRFKKETFYELLSKRLVHLSQNLGQHRQRNFIGKMLQHHTLQSTKYLGKWIQEKNTNNQQS